MAKKHAFTAKIERFGPLYGVRAPAAVSRAIGVRGQIPIVVRVADVGPFRATLLPSGGGRHHLFVNGERRTAAGAKLGDAVAIELRVDREPRGVELVDDLARALREEGVLAAWESLPAGKREHIVRWIDKAVHEETRDKRIARAVVEALAQHEKRIDRGMC